jgi:hypothetical protein
MLRDALIISAGVALGWAAGTNLASRLRGLSFQNRFRLIVFLFLGGVLFVAISERLGVDAAFFGWMFAIAAPIAYVFRSSQERSKTGR